MWWVIRHTIAILVLPVTVVVIIPVWIAGSVGTEIRLPVGLAEWSSVAVGIGVMVGGGALFVACLLRFGVEGKGTLAPWDPPGHLVVTGPYAHVRNPMISGVIFLLLAEGLLLRSGPHLQWAGVFFLINGTYIPLLEEPLLAARFGEEYERYKKGVPRLIPRLQPWRGG